MCSILANMERKLAAEKTMLLYKTRAVLGRLTATEGELDLYCARLKLIVAYAEWGHFTELCYFYHSFNYMNISVKTRILSSIAILESKKITANISFAGQSNLIMGARLLTLGLNTVISCRQASLWCEVIYLVNNTID